MNKNICAGIVTFNPDITRLLENIQSIYNQVPRIIICDNGSTNLYEINSHICKFKNVEIIELDDNKGIAYALNILCKEASSYGFKWILTLDQDSISPENLVSILFNYIDPEKTAICSPQILYRNNEEFFKNNDKEFEYVKWTITSASLTNLKIWEDLGGFDVDLFIDKVDYDYCVRAGLRGYEIIRVNCVSLMHELGNLKCKKLFGHTINITNHSAFRYYYMARNSVILKKRFKHEKTLKEIIKLLVKVNLFEKNKFEKTKSIFKGCFDGLKYEQNG